MKFPEEIFYGIKDRRVIEAINSIPREDFLPDRLIDYAYADTALPIGFDQTISQPSLVAYMTQLLNLTGVENVLEIGTGSGYQTALLAKLAKKVYTIEIVEELYRNSQKTLKDMGTENVQYKLGSGYQGWEEHAPFQGILVTAAPPEIPKKLLKQLKDGGRMVVPVGGRNQVQVLKLIVKVGKDFIEEDKTYVRFVPMVD